MELRLGVRRDRKGAYCGFSLDGASEWMEVRNVWMRDWVCGSKKQGNKYKTAEYEEWFPSERAESCCFKRSSRRKFLRLPKQQQDSISTWVIENVLSKSRPVFVISSAGELLCYDMERHSPTWVNCSFRYKFDGKPRTITLKVNGISVEFSLPKSAELAIRECFRHDGINFCWCDTVCVNIVYMVTGDRELTKPMLSSMGETYLRAPTCVLETALRDDLFYTRSWTIQECLLSKPLQNPRQCYCQLSQRTRRIRVDLNESSTPDVVVPVIKSMIQRVAASGMLYPTDAPFAALSIIQALGFIDTIPSAVSYYHQLFAPCTVVLARELNRSPKGYDYLRWKHSYGSLQSAQVCALLLSEQELAQAECPCTMIGGIASGPWLTCALERMTFATLHTQRAQAEPLLAFIARRLKARPGLQGIQELFMSLVLDMLYFPFAAMGLLLETLSGLCMSAGHAPKLAILDIPARSVVSLGVLLGSAVVHLDTGAFVNSADPRRLPVRIRSPLMSVLGVLMITVPRLLSVRASIRAYAVSVVALLGVVGTEEEKREGDSRILIARVLSIAFYCLSWTDETAEGTMSTIVAALVVYQSEHVGLPDALIPIPYFFVVAAGISTILAFLAPFLRASAFWGKLQLVGVFLVWLSSLLCIISVHIGTSERDADCKQRFPSADHVTSADDTCPPPLQLMLCWAVPMAVTALWSLKRRAEKQNWTLPARLLAWLFSLATTLLVLLSAHPRSLVCDPSDAKGSSDTSSISEEAFCIFSVTNPQRFFIVTVSALGAVVVVVVIPACWKFVTDKLRKRKEVLPSSKADPSDAGKFVPSGPKLGRKNTMMVRMPVVGACTHKAKKEMLKILESCGVDLNFGKDPEILINFNETVHGIVQALEQRRLSHAEGFAKVDRSGTGQLTIGDFYRGLLELDLIVDEDTIRDLYRSMLLGSVEPSTDAEGDVGHNLKNIGPGAETDTVSASASGAAAGGQLAGETDAATASAVSATVDLAAWLRLLGASYVDPNPTAAGIPTLGSTVAAPPPQRRTLRRRSMTEPNLNVVRRSLGEKAGSRRRLLEIEELDGSFTLKKQRERTEKKEEEAKEEEEEAREHAREEEPVWDRQGSVVERRPAYRTQRAAAVLSGSGGPDAEPPVDLDVAPSRSQWQPPGPGPGPGSRAGPGAPQRRRSSLAEMEPLPLPEVPRQVEPASAQARDHAPSDTRPAPALARPGPGPPEQPGTLQRQGSIPVNLFRANSGKFKLRPLPGVSSSGGSEAGQGPPAETPWQLERFDSGSGPADSHGQFGLPVGHNRQRRKSSLADMDPLPLPGGSGPT